MNIIIGAGISGLGAFYGDDTCEIYEKNGYAGGLCSSFKINEFTFDNAVHLSFTKSTEVRNVFDKVAYYVHKPESSSWYHERWLKHPAQNNLFPCTVEDKVNAIESFFNRPELNEEDSFSAWLIAQYGTWLYKNLFRPYNEKYWCTDIETMGVEWLGQRFYKPSLDEFLYGCLSDDTPNTFYAKEMRYPREGGYISFLKNIICKAEKNNKIHYQKKVVSIHTDKHKIVFSDGTEKYYEKLFSSIPLPNMSNLISNFPENLSLLANELEYTKIALVSFGFNKVVDFKNMWFYFYDSDIKAARAYVPSLKSTYNVPEGYSSIQFEIYFNCKDAPPNKEECIDNCKYALKKIGLNCLEHIIFSDYRVLEWGNIIFKKGTEERAKQINAWLKEQDIIPIGRFGEWKYFWSDQAFLSGFSATKMRVDRG